MSNLRKETVEYASDSFTKTITHDYDKMGMPLVTAYPGGRTVTHAYDDLERIATIHSSQGGNGSNLLAAYDYLGAGRVERRTLAGNGTRLDYGFDAIGRVNATTHAVTATSAVFDERSYAWDKASNKTQRVELVASVPVKTYDYQYDSLNRLKRSIKTVGAAAAGTAGNWTGAMTLNTVTPAIADFMGGTPLQLQGDFDVPFNTGSLGVYVTKVQGTRDEAVDYPADLQGYTTAQIDARAPARPEQGTFDIYASALDGANRVYSDPKSITYGPHIIEYDLDGAGNRKELATQAETAPDTYTDLATVAYTEDGTTPAPADAQMNQYTTVPEEASARLYDENGNLLQTGTAAPAVFRHDYLDRIHDRDDGQVVATYLYDALGRRIEKSVDDGTVATTTRYLYDGVRVAEEWDVPDMGAPALSASYVYGNYIDEVLTMRRGSADYYYHADDQFNVVKLTDNTGAVVEGYDYGDYGQPEFFDATGAVAAGTAYANPYLFTGRRWDEELGYYYFRNRYMDPVHGRFASRDPLGLWGDGANLGNAYTYAASNPWSLVDPLGLEGQGNAVPPGGAPPHEPPGEDNSLLDGSEYRVMLPEGEDSRYAMDVAHEVGEAFEDALHEQVIWAAEGVAFLPGPAGLAGDGVVAVFTGKYWTLVPVFGGQIMGGLRKVTHAEFLEDLVKLYGNTRSVRKELSAFQRASEFGVRPFNELRKYTKGTGLHRHHLIEKRFANALELDQNRMAAIALTKGEHQVFTNAWRALIPHGEATELASKSQIMDAARKVYKDYPEIRKVLGI